jgi:predicted deacylase
MILNALNQPIFCPIIRYKSKTNPKGPKIVLTCLNHGDEVIGLEAAFSVLQYVKLNDKLFHGELVIFSCLNYEGFVRSSRYFEAENQNSSSIPNLNRVWGSETENSFSSTFAQDVFGQILDEKPDLVLDLHSYASNSLVHSILDRPGGELEKKLVQICKNSNLPFYLEYEAGEYAAQMLDRSLSNQLCLRGVAAITVELGPKKGFNLDQSKLALQALRNILIANHSLENQGVVDLYNLQNTSIESAKLYYRQGIYNESEFSGYYRPLVNIGIFIKKDSKIAQVINLLGDIVHEVTMPEDGYILALEDVAMVYPKLQIGVMISNLNTNSSN